MNMISDAPRWFEFACKEIGTREEPENRGPAIRRYIKLAGVGKEGWPWCAIFANAMLALAGEQGTKSAGAQSFANAPKLFRKIKTPILGCIVVFWRGSRKSGLGHVGFYNGEKGNYISVVGGNESDMVREEMFPKNARSFGLIGYYMPVRYADAEGGTLYKIGPFAPVVSNKMPLGSTGKVT